jgi:hypothetical protein
MPILSMKYIFADRYYRFAAIAALIFPFVSIIAAIAIVISKKTYSGDAAIIATIFCILSLLCAITFALGYYQLSVKHGKKFLQYVSLLSLIFPLINESLLIAEAWTRSGLTQDLITWQSLIYAIFTLIFAAAIYELYSNYGVVIHRLRIALVIWSIGEALVAIVYLGMNHGLGIILGIICGVIGLVSQITFTFLSAHLFFAVADGKVLNQDAKNKGLGFFAKALIVIGLFFIFQTLFVFGLLFLLSFLGNTKSANNQTINESSSVRVQNITIIGCPHTDRITPTSLCYTLPATILTINGSHNNEIDLLDEVTLPSGTKWFAYDIELGSENEPAVTIDDNGTEWAFASQNSLAPNIATPQK